MSAHKTHKNNSTLNSVAKRSGKETHPDTLMQKFDLKFADLKESLTVFLEKKFQSMTEKFNKLFQLVAKLENEIRKMGALKQRASELENC